MKIKKYRKVIHLKYMTNMVKLYVNHKNINYIYVERQPCQYMTSTTNISIIFMLSVTTYENKVKEYNNVTH